MSTPPQPRLPDRIVLCVELVEPMESVPVLQVCKSNTIISGGSCFEHVALINILQGNKSADCHIFSHSWDSGNFTIGSLLHSIWEYQFLSLLSRDRKYKSASNWFIFLLFYPPHGSRACQWWGHRGWGSSTQKLVSMSSFRSPPVANMKSEFFSEMHHHLDDRNVAVTLESLLDVPQQVLLVHAGSCVDVGVHLDKFKTHWKWLNFILFGRCRNLCEKRPSARPAPEFHWEGCGVDIWMRQKLHFREEFKTGPNILRLAN